MISRAVGVSGRPFSSSPRTGTTMPKWFPTYPEFCERPKGGDICDGETESACDGFAVKGHAGPWVPYPWRYAPPESAVHSFAFESCVKFTPHYSRLAWLAWRSWIQLRFKPDDAGFLKRYYFYFDETDDARGLGFYNRMLEAADPADVVADLIASRVLYVRSA